MTYKGTRLLQGKGHKPFTSKNTEDHTEYIVRKVHKEIGFSLAEIEWLLVKRGLVSMSRTNLELADIRITPPPILQRTSRCLDGWMPASCVVPVRLSVQREQYYRPVLLQRRKRTPHCRNKSD